MHTNRMWILAIAVAWLLGAGCSGRSGTSTDTASETASPTAVDSDSGSLEDTALETVSQDDTNAATDTGTCSAKDTATDSATGTDTAFATDSESASGSESDSDTACIDQAIALGPGDVVALSIDNSHAANSLDASCETEAETADSIIEITLLAPGRLMLSSESYMDYCSTPPNPKFALFEGPAALDCSTLGDALACFDGCTLAPYLHATTNELAAGTYYFLVADGATGVTANVELEIAFRCPEHQHVEEAVCVNDTCADLADDCTARHMGCSDAVSPAVCDGCLPGYELDDQHCKVPGLAYGDPCEQDADCPGQGASFRCASIWGYNPFPGNYCLAINSADCVADGEPCADDPESICIMGSTSQGAFCLKACVSDDDCRPGYLCNPDWGLSGRAACDVIPDCTTRGCNDGDGSMSCYDRDIWDVCWDDPCAPQNPCDGLSHANGECAGDLQQGHRCGCDTGHRWNDATLSCEAWSCDAENLGVFTGATITRSGEDLCVDGTAHYGNGYVGCVHESLLGSEKVYRLEIPAGQTVRFLVRLDGWSFFLPPALYLVDSCDDFYGESCQETESLSLHTGVLISFDRSLVLANETASARTVFAVLDSYFGCGAWSFEVERVCPDTHALAGPNGACVDNTCEDIADACAARNRVCDPGDSAAFCGACLPGYEPYGDRCVLGAYYGSPCEKSADCIGEGELDEHVSCQPTVGGYCVAIQTENCAVNGDPCTDDPGSVCLVSYEYGVRYCAKACETDEDCRPGYRCSTNILHTGHRACEAIADGL